MILKITNDIAHLILDHPQTGNSLGIQEAKQLSQILKQLKNNPEVIGLCLSSSSPRFFCTGGNLDEQAKIKARAQGIRYHRQIRKSLTDLENFGRPVVAIVEGLCLGGGTELISCADHIIATPAALFGFWQRKIGLSFGWGGGARLLKRLPLRTLQGLLVTIQNLTALEAQAIGLVDQLVPAWSTQARAQAWLRAAHADHSLKKWNSKEEQSLFESLLWKGEHLELLTNRRQKT